MRNGTPWTQKQTDFAVKQYHAGVPYAEIGRRMGEEGLGARTKQSVSGHLKRLNLFGTRDRSQVKPMAKMAGGSSSRCQWPLWGPEKRVGEFCGAPVHRHYPYCEPCCRRAYKPLEA